MIAVDGLTIRLGGATILDDVSLSVDRGSWTSLIGPNGAGKTTLLRAVAGLIAPAAGRVAVDGRDPRDGDARRHARTVALVPQAPLLPPDMTVGEYVMLGRTPHLGYLGRTGHADENATALSIARLDLTVLAERRLATLSGGERQRAVLARALNQDAPILLLDEPTAALDIGRQQEALELVSELRAERGLTVLAALHDLTLAAQHADRVALLAAGRVVAAGTPVEVITREQVELHYRAHVHVTVHDGRPAVLPTRP